MALAASGVYGNVKLIAFDTALLRGVHMHQSCSGEAYSLEFEAQLLVPPTGDAGTLWFSIPELDINEDRQYYFDGSSADVFVRHSISVPAADVSLWWPVGMGNQTLYNVSVLFASNKAWNADSWMEFPVASSGEAQGQQWDIGSLSDDLHGAVAETEGFNPTAASTASFLASTPADDESSQGMPQMGGEASMPEASIPASRRRSRSLLLSGGGSSTSTLPDWVPDWLPDWLLLSGIPEWQLAIAVERNGPQTLEFLSHKALRIGFRVVELVQKPLKEAVKELLTDSGSTGWSSPYRVGVGQRNCFQGPCGQWGWVNASRWEFIVNPFTPKSTYVTGKRIARVIITRSPVFRHAHTHTTHTHIHTHILNEASRHDVTALL